MSNLPSWFDNWLTDDGSDDKIRCIKCEKFFDEDDMVDMGDGEWMCEDCFEEYEMEKEDEEDDTI